MNSRKEKRIIRDFDKKIDNRKAGAKRRADSKQRKPSMVYRYCKSIINFGIKSRLNMLLWIPGSIQINLHQTFRRLAYTVSA